tara:strand:+ start:5363 stop:5590 length:228 start_codon:yes stop_codon:yes gene_type:complete
MKRKSQYRSIFIYSLIAPIMVLITIVGFTFRSEKKKNFYIPLGTIGIYLIIDKELSRRLNRKNLLNKIKFFKNNK